MPTEEQLIEFLKKYQVNEQNKSPWPTFDSQLVRAYQVNWEAFFPSVRRIYRDGEYEWDLYGDEWQPDLETDFERPLQEALQADYPTEKEISDMAQMLSISEMGHFLNRTLLPNQTALTGSLRSRL